MQSTEKWFLIINVQIYRWFLIVNIQSYDQWP